MPGTSGFDKLPAELLQALCACMQPDEPGLDTYAKALKAQDNMRLSSALIQATITDSESTCIITDPVKPIFWASYVDCGVADDLMDTPEANKRFAESYVNYAGTLVFTGAHEHTFQVWNWGAWAWNSIVSTYSSGSVDPPLFPNLDTVVIGLCVDTEVSRAEIQNYRNSNRLSTLSWTREGRSYAQHLLIDVLKLPLKEMCYHAHDITTRSHDDDETTAPALPDQLPPHLRVHCSLATVPMWNTANQTTPCSQIWYVTVPTDMAAKEQMENLRRLCNTVWKAMLPQISAEPVKSIIHLNKGYAGENVVLDPQAHSLHPDTGLTLVTEGPDDEDEEIPRCTLCTDSFCTRSGT